MVSNTKKALIDLLSPEDLKEHNDLYLINEACGLDVVKKILLVFSDGAETLKKPSLKTIKPLLVRFIDENKDKSDKEIASGIGVSDSYIYKLRTNYKDY